MARRRRGRVVGGGGSGIPNAVQAPAQNPYVQQAPPVDPGFEAYRVGAQRDVALADADATYQTARLDNTYGLGADQSNPHSMGKLLEANFRRSQRGTLNSYAAMGQKNSGAYQRMQRENEREYNIGFDRLARDYQDQRYGIVRGQLGSYAQNAAGVDQASFDALLRALRGGV